MSSSSPPAEAPSETDMTATIDRPHAHPPALHPNVAVENADGRGSTLLLCDHASAAIPDGYGNLGLDESLLSLHIALDNGALSLSRTLAERLDATLVHPLVSRLFVDCNRAPDADDLIVEISDGIAIPGNQKIDRNEKQKRLAAVHQPYHRQIAAIIEARQNSPHPFSCILGIHSFTPVHQNIRRPWHVGLLYDKDPELSRLFIDAFKKDGLTVGDNQPYNAAGGFYWTLSVHAETRNIPNAVIEIRDDQLSSEPQRLDWASRIERALTT